VEACCNKCELPTNHFLYCIPLLFYFICTLDTQFHISLHKFIDLHYRTILLTNINIMLATLITLTQKHYEKGDNPGAEEPNPIIPMTYKVQHSLIQYSWCFPTT